jgi:hypothetical protein
MKYCCEVLGYIRYAKCQAEFAISGLPLPTCSYVRLSCNLHSLKLYSQTHELLSLMPLIAHPTSLFVKYRQKH